MTQCFKTGKLSNECGERVRKLISVRGVKYVPLQVASGQMRIFFQSNKRLPASYIKCSQVFIFVCYYYVIITVQCTPIQTTLSPWKLTVDLQYSVAPLQPSVRCRCARCRHVLHVDG